MKNLTLLIIINLSQFSLSTESFGQYKPNMSPVAVTNVALMNAFKQGTARFSSITYNMMPGGGNCASIAIIKAAIGTFGLYNVFKAVVIDTKNQEYQVTLRNGDTLKLHFDRLKMAADYFAFDNSRVGKDKLSMDILEYSQFCFAVMARVKQLRRGHFQEKFYYHAVDNLNKGEDTQTIYELLGLQKEDIGNPASGNLNINKHMIVWNGPHAVYAFNGQYDEAFVGIGRDTGIENLSVLETEHCDKDRCEILGAYTIKSE